VKKEEEEGVGGERERGEEEAGRGMLREGWREGWERRFQRLVFPSSFSSSSSSFSSSSSSSSFSSSPSPSPYDSLHTIHNSKPTEDFPSLSVHPPYLLDTTGIDAVVVVWSTEKKELTKENEKRLRGNNLFFFNFIFFKHFYYYLE
jgi:hypothetical protein